MTLTREALVELVRQEIAKGLYQMPFDTLPHETKAQVIVGAIEAAGYLDIREAEKRRRYAAISDADPDDRRHAMGLRDPRRRMGPRA